FTITGNNSGIVTPGSIHFSSFENLRGGAGNDTFYFHDGKKVSGTINGGGGVDTLDYSQYTTAVTTSLGAQTTTGAVGGISNIEGMVGGSSANDRFTALDDGNSWNITGYYAGNVKWMTASGMTLLIHTFTFEGVEELRGGSQTDNFRLDDDAAITS